MRDESDVLGEDIDVIARRDDDPHLEFSREIDASVDRVLRLGRQVRRPEQLDFFAVEPDVDIRRTAPKKSSAEFIRERFGVAMRRIIERRGRSHRVAHHVAARSHRRQPASIDRRDDFLEPALEHAVKLNPLPRRQSQRTVRQRVPEPVVNQVLLRRQPPARHLRTHHELPRLFLLLLRQLRPQVPVILLIRAVKLQQ